MGALVMARFKLSFECMPEVIGPWANRKSSRLKMMQSVTDYITRRCSATNVTILELVDTPAVEEAKETEKSKKKATTRK